jgi:hypothetical protein
MHPQIVNTRQHYQVKKVDLQHKEMLEQEGERSRENGKRTRPGLERQDTRDFVPGKDSRLPSMKALKLPPVASRYCPSLQAQCTHFWWVHDNSRKQTAPDSNRRKHV